MSGVHETRAEPDAIRKPVGLPPRLHRGVVPGRQCRSARESFRQDLDAEPWEDVLMCPMRHARRRRR